MIVKTAANAGTHITAATVYCPRPLTGEMPLRIRTPSMAYVITKVMKRKDEIPFQSMTDLSMRVAFVATSVHVTRSFFLG